MTIDSKNKLDRFFKALDILAPADDSGCRVFRDRGVSVCVGHFTISSEGFVKVLSLVSLPTEGRDGKRLTMAGVNYLADLFDVTLVAMDTTLIRHVNGLNEDPSWLIGSGFVCLAGESLHLRLPQSIHRVAA